MARRKSLLKDLTALSFRLPCRVAVGLAVVSFAALHMIASDAPAPVGGGASGDLGIVFVRQVGVSGAMEQKTGLRTRIRWVSQGS